MYLLSENEISQISGGNDLAWKGEALVNAGFTLLGMSSIGFMGLQLGSILDKYTSVGRGRVDIGGPAGGMFGLGIGAFVGLFSAAFFASAVLQEMRKADQ